MYRVPALWKEVILDGSISLFYTLGVFAIWYLHAGVSTATAYFDTLVLFHRSINMVWIAHGHTTEMKNLPMKVQNVYQACNIHKAAFEAFSTNLRRPSFGETLTLICRRFLTFGTIPDLDHNISLVQQVGELHLSFEFGKVGEAESS